MLFNYDMYLVLDRIDVIWLSTRDRAHINEEAELFVFGIPSNLEAKFITPNLD